MSIHDRHYSRGGAAGGGGFDGDLATRILRWLNASIPVGTYLGISVRVHITFVLLLIFQMLRDQDPAWTLRWAALLFGSVLLHEFGHCLACRRVGGQADHILMWPLGGLAFCAPPPRPWPEFVTVVWGPLVNVILAAAAYLTLLLWFGSDSPVSLHPLQMYVPANFSAEWLARLITDVFVVNYALLLFNVLLIFYPFDGGRMVQIALWTRIGYARSLRFATSFGMGGAILIVLFAIATNQTLLLVIAAFGFITCYRQARVLRETADFDVGLEPSWSTGGPERGERERRAGLVASWRARRARKQARRQAGRQRKRDEQIDRILKKVHEHGLASLSTSERRTLQQASDNRRREP